MEGVFLREWESQIRTLPTNGLPFAQVVVENTVPKFGNAENEHTHRSQQGYCQDHNERMSIYHVGSLNICLMFAATIFARPPSISIARVEGSHTSPLLLTYANLRQAERFGLAPLLNVSDRRA